MSGPIYNEKLRKRSRELAEELEGILDRIENWDIHDIDLEILRMKKALEEEINGSNRIKKRIEILEERI